MRSGLARWHAQISSNSVAAHSVVLRADGRGAHDTFSSSRGGGGQRGYQQQQQLSQQHPEDDEGDLVDTWQQLAYFLKQQCPGE